MALDSLSLQLRKSTLMFWSIETHQNFAVIFLWLKRFTSICYLHDATAEFRLLYFRFLLFPVPHVLFLQHTVPLNAPH